MQSMGFHKVLAVVIERSEGHSNVNTLRIPHTKGLTSSITGFGKRRFAYPVINILLHALDLVLERIIQLEVQLLDLQNIAFFGLCPVWLWHLQEAQLHECGVTYADRAIVAAVLTRPVAASVAEGDDAAAAVCPAGMEITVETQLAGLLVVLGRLLVPADLHTCALHQKQRLLVCN